jgi:hypothetical protein
MNNNETVAGTPADPTLEFTSLKINGKTYKLIYDFDAIADIEEETNIPLLVGIDFRRLNVRQVRAMLCACMRKAHPAVSPKVITPWIVPKNMPLIIDALIQTWFVSTAKRQEDESAENPPTPEAPKPSES